jgi:hypothetical protein
METVRELAWLIGTTADAWTVPLSFAIVFDSFVVTRALSRWRRHRVGITEDATIGSLGDSRESHHVFVGR